MDFCLDRQPARKLLRRLAGCATATLCFLQACFPASAATKLDAWRTLHTRGAVTIPTQPRTYAALRPAATAATTQLVYVSEYRSGKVLAYAANTATPPTAPTITITGLRGPWGLAFDAARNLYVAESNGGDVRVFAPGATTPFKTLSGLPAGSRPFSVAVDGKGTVYVTNGNVVEVYRNGATTPSLTLGDPSIAGFDDMVVDNAGNIFIAYYTNSGLSVGTFPSTDSLGAGFLIPLVNVDAGGLPYQIKIDKNGDLLVGDLAPNHATIGIYPAAQQSLMMTLPIPDPSGLDVFALTGPNNRNLFYAPQDSGMLYKMTFPGCTPEETIALIPGDQVGDVIVSPQPPSGIW